MINQIMDNIQNIEIVLLRHGKTKANIEGRYAGRTDYPVLEDGKAELSGRDYSAYQDVRKVFISPLLRCRQTADIIFPSHEKIVIPDLIECDFGTFEDRTAKEMEGYKEFQDWVDSGGTLPFPKGEDVEEFKDRCAEAMKEVMDICRVSGIKKAAVVSHGGVVMSIMERLCSEKRGYYEWHPDNGCGYVVRTGNDGILELVNEIIF